MKQEKEYWDLSNVHVNHFQMTITLQNNILCAKQNGEITYVEYVYHLQMTISLQNLIILCALHMEISFSNHW